MAWLALAAGAAHAQGTAKAPAAAQPAANAPAAQPAANPPAADKPLENLVDDFCSKCHNTTDWAGNVAMDSMDLAHPGEDAEIWEKAIAKLTGRLMPPAGQKQPEQADVDATLHYLEDLPGCLRAGSAASATCPLQRLSRAEFAASVKGLLGVDVDPKQILPTEIEVDGFSNVAGAL